MQTIKRINAINQNELKNNVSDEASWHCDYSNTLYIYIGNLDSRLDENNIIKIFSQYGIPTHINLLKDKITGMSRGFCYLKFKNYKSCVLTVDNFIGIKLFDKPIKVDHVFYKLKSYEKESDFLIDYSAAFKDHHFNNHQKVNTHMEKKTLKSEFIDPMIKYLKDK